MSVFIEGSQPKEKLDEFTKSAFTNFDFICQAMELLTIISKIDKMAIVVTMEMKK
jgi:hypothetical protein